MKRLLSISMAFIVIISSLVLCLNTAYAADNSINHYSFSFNTLKDYLKKYGKISADGSTGYFISKEEKTDLFDHFYTISYNNRPELDFHYSCRRVDENGNVNHDAWLYVDMIIPESESSEYSLKSMYVSESNVYGNATITPGIYDYSETIKFTFEDSLGRFTNDNLNKTMNTALSLAVPNWNSLLNTEVGITLGNFKFTKLFNEETSIYPKFYTVRFDANGHGTSPSSIEVMEASKINSPYISEEGFIFGGWFKESACINKWDFENDTVDSNIILYAKWDKIPNPTGKSFVNVGAGKEVSYKSTVIITANAENVPSGYYVAIYEGSNRLKTGDNKTVSYTVENITGNKTFTVKVIDSSGKIQKDSNENLLQKEIAVTVDTGFFARLIAFFQGLFGALPKVEIKP